MSEKLLLKLGVVGARNDRDPCHGEQRPEERDHLRVGRGFARSKRPIEIERNERFHGALCEDARSPSAMPVSVHACRVPRGLRS
jgi:hypothetical protein